MSGLSIEPFRDLYPFESRFIELGPHRMHYLDEGQGETLLMLHGNPTWSFYYRNLVKGLRSQYRCVVPDHIGCGLSDKPQEYNYTLSQHIDNLAALVDHLNLDHLTLVMHDWGGSIGMGLAVRAPEKIKRLIFSTPRLLLPIAFHSASTCADTPSSDPLRFSNSTCSRGWRLRGPANKPTAWWARYGRDTWRPTTLRKTGSLI